MCLKFSSTQQLDFLAIKEHLTYFQATILRTSPGPPASGSGSPSVLSWCQQTSSCKSRSRRRTPFPRLAGCTPKELRGLGGD